MSTRRERQALGVGRQFLPGVMLAQASNEFCRWRDLSRRRLQLIKERRSSCAMTWTRGRQKDSLLPHSAPRHCCVVALVRPEVGGAIGLERNAIVPQPGAGPRNGAIGFGAAAGLPGRCGGVSLAPTSMLPVVAPLSKAVAKSADVIAEAWLLVTRAAPFRAERSRRQAPTRLPQTRARRRYVM
jgi:hypothetical protein